MSKLKSVISYPDRGPWGKSSWRGNCSGRVIVDLIDTYQPSTFIDVCEGSGTSRDVCREMGVDYVGLDLHKGNDYTRDSVLAQIPWKSGADISFSHPAYHSMIAYSGSVWGKEKVKGDASNCATVNEFLEMSQVMLMNQREATKQGGVYATLIGDMRKSGSFHSFQADYLRMCPRDENIAVVIKQQHNCLSDGRVYGGSFVPILHEYLLIFRKKSKTMMAVCWDKALEYKQAIAQTWRTAIRLVMMQIGKGTLKEIYAMVEDVAGNLIAKNQHWKAKIRQLLQVHYTNVERGVWAV